MLQRFLIAVSLVAIVASVGAYFWTVQSEQQRQLTAANLEKANTGMEQSGAGISAQPQASPAESQQEIEAAKPAVALEDNESTVQPSHFVANNTQDNTNSGFSLPQVPAQGVAVPPRLNAVPAPAVTDGVLVFKGSLAFVDDRIIPSRADGILQEYHFDEGSTVNEGDVMVEIDSELAKAEVEVASKELESATLKAEDESQIKFSEASLAVARQTFERSKAMYAKNVEGIDDYEKKRLEEIKAGFQVEVSFREQKINRAAVGVNTAKLHAAEVQVKLRTIKAPFSGIIAETKKKRFDWVKAGDEILRLVSMEKFRVRGSVKNASPNALLGAPAKVTVIVSPSETVVVQGVVGFVHPKSEGDHEYPVWVEISNQLVNGQYLFRGGMDAMVEINTRR